MARVREILFADDSIAHARIAREALAELDVVPHRLTVANTGAAALDRLFLRPPFETARQPDLVLLDLDLPVVTGLDVLAAVKSDERTRSVPVVVMTRAPRPEDLAACFALGANSVVEFPVRLEDLAATIRAVVDYWARTNVMPGARGE
jgi:two-component system response regulator